MALHIFFKFYISSKNFVFIFFKFYKFYFFIPKGLQLDFSESSQLEFFIPQNSLESVDKLINTNKSEIFFLIFVLFYFFIIILLFFYFYFHSHFYFCFLLTYFFYFINFYFFHSISLFFLLLFL